MLDALFPLHYLSPYSIHPLITAMFAPHLMHLLTGRPRNQPIARNQSVHQQHLGMSANDHDHLSMSQNSTYQELTLLLRWGLLHDKSWLTSMAINTTLRQPPWS